MSVNPIIHDQPHHARRLAAVTFALFIVSAAMGEDFGEGNALLWTLGDIV